MDTFLFLSLKFQTSTVFTVVVYHKVKFIYKFLFYITLLKKVIILLCGNITDISTVSKILHHLVIEEKNK